MQKILLSKSIIGASLAFALIGCNGDDSGYLDKPAPPTPSPTTESLKAYPTAAMLTEGETQTINIAGVVTAVGIDQWALTSVEDTGALGDISKQTVTGFDYLANASGLTTLPYEVQGGGKTSTSEVLVAINAKDSGQPDENTPPTAQNITLETLNNQDVSVNINKYIFDADNDALSVKQLITTSGRFSLGTDGYTLSFKPDGFVGVDQAVYSVEDGNSGYAIAYVIVASKDVNPIPPQPNTRPVAKDFAQNIDSKTTPIWAIDLAALKLISDADDDSLTIENIFSGNGRAVKTGATTINYTPAGFIGIDQFTYVISDGKGGYATGTISVTVSNSTTNNTVPTATSLVVSEVMDNDMRPIIIDVSANVTDADSDTLRIANVMGANGTVAINTANPLEIDYTPPSPTQGLEDNFSYVITDGNGGYAMSTVKIEFTAHNPNAPIAEIIELTTLYNQSLRYTLTEDDISDADTSYADLTVSNLQIKDPVTSSTATVTLEGKTIVYDPKGFTGVEVLTYTLSDGELTTTGTVVIAVNPDDAPHLKANDFIASLNLNPGIKGYAIPWISGVSSTAADGKTFDLVHLAGAALGTASIDADNRIYYAPKPGIYGTDRVVYTVKDSHTPAHYVQGVLTVVLNPPAPPKITTLTIDGIPIIDSVLTANVTCANCDESKYKYKWVINGLEAGAASTYTYRGEDAGFNIRLEVIGVDTYEQRVQHSTTYEVTSAKQVLLTGDWKATGILDNNGTFKSYGTGTAANKTISNVKTVVNDSKGFILITDNGKLTAVGDIAFGYGVPSAVDVVKVVSTGASVLALQKDGKISAEGMTDFGGVIPEAVKPYALDVRTISSAQLGFGIINGKGEAVSWQDDWVATPATNSELIDIKELFLDSGNNYALNDKGGLIRFGSVIENSDYIKFDDIKPHITDVISFKTNGVANIALNQDGSAVAWGEPTRGGDSSLYTEQLKSNVIEVGTVDFMLYARKSSGELYVWGQAGDVAIPDNMEKIKSIVKNNYAAAVLSESGAVYSFGKASYGANSGSVSEQLRSGVKEIYASTYGFSALKVDGSVVTWGTFDILPPDNLSSIASIIPRYGLFIAQGVDGNIVSWGSSRVQGRAEIEKAMRYTFTQIE